MIRPIRLAAITTGLLLIVLYMHAPNAFAQAPGYAEITSPLGGEALRGIVTIEGSASHPAFKSYTLSFTYELPEPYDWFPIGNASETQVTAGKLSLWDTTGISDGNYQLRLVVELENGSSLETIVHGLRIRNETPVETSTPTPIGAIGAATATAPPPTSTPRPTPIAIVSDDPVKTTFSALSIGMIAGASAVVLTLAAFAVRKQMRTRLAMLRMRHALWQQDRRRNRRRHS